MHIIDHRVKTVEKNLDDLKSVLKNIEKKSEFAEELDNTGSEPAFEIKEVCNRQNTTVVIFLYIILYIYINSTGIYNYA